MRTAAELVADLRQRGVELRAEGDRLRFQAPPGALPAALRSELVRRKAEVVPLVAATAGGGAYRHLFEPLAVGPLTLANRLVLSPMEVDFGAAGGEVTPRAVAYYAARAAGGVGLVVVEATSVDASGLISPVQLRADDDAFLPGLTGLVRGVHRHGVPAVLQLQHAGRKTSALVTGERPVAPSPVANHRGETPRALSGGEIEDLVERYAAAAARARAAGFDGVEIHAAHGYLVAQFLSPLYNHRDDRWGGDLEGRARFLLAVVAAVRRRAGAGFPVLVRLSAADLEAAGDIRPHPRGLTVQEAARVAVWLETEGVAAVDVSATLVGAPRMHPMSWPEAHLAHLAATVKSALSVPVSMTSRVPPRRAEELVAAGGLDLVRLGRALLADPDLPRKLAAGRDEEVRPCIYCGVCTDPARRRPEVVCTVNPALGREAEDDLAPAAVPLRVAVAGGGPAGLEAARVAALRGHRVVLFEAAGELGGQLRVDSRPPAAQRSLDALRRHLVAAATAAGVEVRLGEPFTPALAEELEAEVVMVATGARPRRPALPGADGDGVIFAAELFAAGPPPAGSHAVVLGSERVGCEAALRLAEAACRVALVGRRGELASRAEADLRAYFGWALDDAGVELLMPARVEAISPGSVRLRQASGRRVVAADTVVLATGAEPDDALAAELAAELAGRGVRVVRLGDCRQPGDLLAALHGAYEEACEL